MSKYGLPLLPERWVGHPDWYDDTTTMDFDVLSRLHPLQGHEPIEKLLQFNRETVQDSARPSREQHVRVARLRS